MFPLTKYHFSVDWGGTRIGFTEVSGLEWEIQPIEYRAGSDPDFFVQKIPGMLKYSNVTLKRGTFQSDNDYYEWINTIDLNNIEKRDITVSLLNEKHEPLFVWSLMQAWPTKLQVTDLKSDGNEICVETLELAVSKFTQEAI